MKVKEEFMKKAIEIAKKSAKEGDYAIGAVIVKDNEVIAYGTTNLKHQNDPTVHAEIVAIRNACKKMNSRYLQDCILYTTYEPCPMCAAAIIFAKMKGIVFGAKLEDYKTKQGENFSWRYIDISCKEVVSKGIPKPELIEGFLRKDCNKLFDLSQ